jgi:putative hydrolase of the HAD superfamily
LSDRALDALIVDFGGVLTTPLQDAMVALAEEEGIDLQDLVRAALRAYSGDRDPLVVDFETGRIAEETFEAEFAARLREVTGVEVSASGLVERLFRSLQIEDEMLKALERARTAGLKTALLSNSWGTKLYPRARIDPLFDVIVISGEVGLRKPDPAIFRLTLDRLEVAAPRSIFVDDHPGHLKAAAELGMQTVLHRTPRETIAELETAVGLPLSGSS